MNYLDRAMDDLDVAKLLLSPVDNPTNDAGKNDIAAYHLQQAIEKALKHVLHDIGGYDEMSKAFRTHNIASLIDLTEEETSFVVPQTVKTISVLATLWEASARYQSSFVATMRDAFYAN